MPTKRSDKVISLTRDFDELEMLRDSEVAVGVSFYAAPGLKRAVLAAVNSYATGAKSIDDYLRRNRKRWRLWRPDPFEKELLGVLTLGKMEVAAVARGLTVPAKDAKTKIRPPHPGLFASEACLLRLPLSFRCVSFLIRQGYVFEAATICRFIIEQLAWSVAVRPIGDNSFLQVEPNACLSQLKGLLPESGRLYGALSNYAHLHPELTPHYLDFSGEFVSIRSNMPGQRLGLAQAYLRLADWYRVVVEWVSFDHLETPTVWKRREDGTLELQALRPLTEAIETWFVVEDEPTGEQNAAG